MPRLVLTVLLVFAATLAQAQSILITNVRIFDGVDAQLATGNVLVTDGRIAQISRTPIQAPDGAEIIAGGNRILTPGFIDLHVHLTMQSPASQPTPHATARGAHAVGIARFYLDHGFTTIRDAGGTHPDLAQAFNTGLLYGPRVFPSGAIVSQTAGHGDSRSREQPHPTHTGDSPYTYGDASIIADGVDATLVAVRENLKNGATQIKIMGGGGVMSDYDPIHSLQPSPAEIRAAVQAAGDWGTYVLAHAYTSEAVRRLVENGVRCIEHGLLIDDATARLVAEKDVVISTQLLIFRTLASMEGLSDNNREKALQVRAGQENLIRLIKKYDITTGFSTDFILGHYEGLPREFTERVQFWTPAEVLRQATSESARVIRMAGKLNRHGDFGEIREGWVADLLIHEGELLDDLSGLADPEANLPLIMKDGKLIKNKL